MFTSRAEYRLLLREDNADWRLTPKGFELGIVDEARFHRFEAKQKTITTEQKRLHATWVRPDTEAGKAIEALLQQPLAREYRLTELLRRPTLTYADLMAISTLGPAVDEIAARHIEIQIKYAGYIERQQDEIAKLQRNEETKIPTGIDYTHIIGLSVESQQKLQAVRPETIGMASRIPGITPAAISLLLVHLKKVKTL
jgi:tRNA uridine 5-carboxymethylaminomethyl modification enzyme